MYIVSLYMYTVSLYSVHSVTIKCTQCHYTGKYMYSVTIHVHITVLYSVCTDVQFCYACTHVNTESLHSVYSVTMHIHNVTIHVHMHCHYACTHALSLYTCAYNATIQCIQRHYTSTHCQYTVYTCTVSLCITQCHYTSTCHY